MEELFELYFRGKLTGPQEKALWEYLNQSAENQERFRDAERLWLQNHPVSRKVSDSYFILEQRIKTAENIKRRRKVFRNASVACVVLLAGLFLGINHFRVHIYTYSASEGSTLDVCLPDGTAVNLNSGSILTYNSRYNRKAREVTLQGEAFFDVRHNPDCPFSVSTDDCSVTVLGTRFNVMDYDGDSNVQIILAEGSLEVDMHDVSDVLKPGDKLEFDGKSVTKTRVPPSDAGLWTSGAICFDNIKLDDFVHRISREYGVSVILEARGFASQSFRASFSHEDSIESILESVCRIFPLKIRKDGDNYKLIYTKKQF